MSQETMMNPDHSSPQLNETRRSSRLWTTVVLSVVLALTFLAFSPVLKAKFVWDDQKHFEWNPLVANISLANQKEIFQSTVFGNYIPLTILSFSLEHHFFGAGPFVYHLDNLLLHLGVVALCFVFARALGLSTLAATLAALLFGIHPIHVESVAWVTQRKDVLYSFFYLLSLLGYLKYLKSQRRFYFFASLLAGLLSVLAKPMAVSLPLVLFLCDWYTGRRLSRQSLFEKAEYLLYILPLMWITYSANIMPVSFSFLSGFLTWVWTVVFYVRKIFIPLDFFPLYELPEPVSLMNLEYLGSLIFFVGLLVLLILKRRKRLLLFSVLFYFVSIFFLLRTDALSAGLNPVADRYMYLPSLGFFLLAAVAIEKGLQTFLKHDVYLRNIIVAVLCCLCAALAVVTHQQTKLWQDGFTLWNFVLSKKPFSAVAHYNVGLEYLKDGLKDQAEKHFLDAVRLRPDYLHGYNNLGNLAFENGRLKEAKQYYEKALSLDPNYTEANSNYGVILMEEGNYPAAEAHLLRAISGNPRGANIWSNLGNLYYLKKDIPRAIICYEKALEWDPLSLYAHNQLAGIYMSVNDYEKAVKHFSDLALFAPNNPEVQNNYGVALLKMGKTKEAISHFEEALRLNPNYVNAARNLRIATTGQYQPLSVPK